MNWLDKLKEIKTKSNMPTREIAIKSGIPEPTLEKIFSGKTKNPGVNTIQLLVHALGYTLDDIDITQKKEPTLVSEDGRKKEFIELFSQLNEEQQKIVVAQIKGILAER